MRRLISILFLMSGLVALPLHASSGGGGGEAKGPATGNADPDLSRPAVENPVVAELRAKLQRAGASERYGLMKQFLEALDAAGMGRGNEAAELINKLVELAPANPVYLWRRADIRRRASNFSGALSDCEQLAQMAPTHPLGIRARRLRANLLFKLGRREEAAQADEALLRDRLADPAAVLIRLARTYAFMGDVERTRNALQRLSRVNPEKVRLDADLAFLNADGADKLGSRQEAARELIRFANVFPEDPRRADALLRAAKVFEAEGSQAFALELMNESVRLAKSPRLTEQGLMEKGDLLATMGQKEVAREEYERAFQGAGSQEAAARALGRHVDLTIEIEGQDRALLDLVARIRADERYAAEAGRPLFGKLVAGMSEKLTHDREKAAFIVELARQAGAELQVPPEVQASAASLWEAVGAYERAGARYRMAAPFPAPTGPMAREAAVRCAPRDLPGGIQPSDPVRIEALLREQAWPLILKAVPAALETKGPNQERARVVGGRAAFMLKDPAWAKELLDPLRNPTKEGALLRGDARALADEWKEACKDYRAAAGPELGPAATEWLEVRLAACEFRENKQEEARARLQALINRKPQEPAALAAELILARIPPPVKPQDAETSGAAKPARSRRRG